jgi:hypothetical protein
MSTTSLADTTAQAYPEVQVLLRCAQTCYNPTSAAQLPRLLCPDFNWAWLIRLALRHRVLPLVYRGMQTIDADLVPPPVWAELQHHFHANAQRNLLLGGTLLRLLRSLARHNIHALPYKGPVLAVAAYGNLALRQFGDLDILVRQQDVERAKDLLLAQGYRWWEQRPHTLLPRQRKVYELISADGQVLVELHWAITSSTFYFPLDPARLWERLETVVLLETPVRTLTPEHLLLILCIHGAKHHWHRLAWICDIAALLHVAAGMDWEHLLEQADRLGCRRMLLLGVFLAQMLLGKSLSEPVRHRLYADAAIPRLAREVQEHLFTHTNRPLAAVDRPLFYLRLRERLRDRLRCSCYLVYHAITSRLLSAFSSAVPRQNRRRGDQELGQEGKEHGQSGEKRKIEGRLKTSQKTSPETQGENERGENNCPPGMAERLLDGTKGVTTGPFLVRIAVQQVDRIVDEQPQSNAGDHGSRCRQLDTAPAHQAKNHHDGKQVGNRCNNAKLPGAQGQSNTP